MPGLITTDKVAALPSISLNGGVKMKGAVPLSGIEKLPLTSVTAICTFCSAAVCDDDCHTGQRLAAGREAIYRSWSTADRITTATATTQIDQHWG